MKDTPANPEVTGRLGPVRGVHWLASRAHVDMSVPLQPPRPLRLPTAPQEVTIDLERTALLIVDMQNDFCAPGGSVDHLGVDYRPDRAPIAPLQRLLPGLRRAAVPAFCTEATVFNVKKCFGFVTDGTSVIHALEQGT